MRVVRRVDFVDANPRGTIDDNNKIDKLEEGQIIYIFKIPTGIVKRSVLKHKTEILGRLARTCRFFLTASNDVARFSLLRKKAITCPPVA
jgi:hypothetical protein